jgi:hypothetical protein
MGASKEQYIHLTGIRPQDTIKGLQRKIKLLEEEIKQLKQYDIDNRTTNEDKPFNGDIQG